jgi:hypothetical protein
MISNHCGYLTIGYGIKVFNFCQFIKYEITAGIQYDQYLDMVGLCNWSKVNS